MYTGQVVPWVRLPTREVEHAPYLARWGASWPHSHGFRVEAQDAPSRGTGTAAAFTRAPPSLYICSAAKAMRISLNRCFAF